MKKNILFPFLILALAIVSCKEEPLINSATNEQNCRISEILAKEYSSHYGSKQRSSQEPRIKSIIKQDYIIINDTLVVPYEQRSRSKIDTSRIFQLQTVEFTAHEKDGYTVMSDDPRINRALFIAEEGSINDTANIEPLKYVIETLPTTASQMISGPKKPINLDVYDKMSVGPLLKTKWGQDYPFNKYAPSCNCPQCKNFENRGHNPIGCVTTATAQFIAHMGKFKSTFYGSRELDFLNLPKKKEDMTSAQQLQIAHFFHEIALCCQIKFGCSGSGTYLKSAYQYLRDLGYDSQFIDGNLNRDNAIGSLMMGTPVLIGGQSDREGHMWVIDGYRYNNEIVEFSCNWGWNGYSDCWTIGNPFTPESEEPYKRGFQYILTRFNREDIM